MNGGQTTVSIFNAHRKGVDLTKVSVPIKFIHLTVSHPVGKKNLLEAISRFSNTQSKVNDADRMVNMAPHPELQEVSQKERVFSGEMDGTTSDGAVKFAQKNSPWAKISFVHGANNSGLNMSSVLQNRNRMERMVGYTHNGASGKTRDSCITTTNHHATGPSLLGCRSPSQKTIGLAKLYYFGKDYMANEFSGCDQRPCLMFWGGFLISWTTSSI